MPMLQLNFQIFKNDQNFHYKTHLFIHRFSPFRNKTSTHHFRYKIHPFAHVFASSFTLHHHTHYHFFVSQMHHHNDITSTLHYLGFHIDTDDLIITMASRPRPPPSYGRDVLIQTGILLPQVHNLFLNCPRCKRVTFHGWQCDICDNPTYPTNYTTADESLHYHPIFIAMYFSPRYRGSERPVIPILPQCFTQRVWEHIQQVGQGPDVGALTLVAPDNPHHTRQPLNHNMVTDASPKFGDNPTDPRNIRRAVLDYLVSEDFDSILTSETIATFTANPPHNILCDRATNQMIVAFQGTVIQLQWLCNDFTREMDSVHFRIG